MEVHERRLLNVVFFTLYFFLLLFSLWGLLLLTGPWIERALGRAAHRTAAFRYGDYLGVIVLLVAGLGGAVLAGDVFIDLAEQIHDESAELRTIDSEVHEWARTTHSSGGTTFFVAMTIIGTPVGLSILIFCVVIALALRKRWSWIAYLILTTSIGGLINRALKQFFARERPELAEALRHASGYSFPSGHAMGSTIVFGAFAYLAFRALRQWRVRAPLVALSLTMIVAISASRLYLGVHWISDVGAGIAAGSIWVVTTTVAYETFRRVSKVRHRRALQAEHGDS
ncbi:MAG TPA: phosphatase PAP2 family protein [Thermoanaerobaculia bacterium]